MSGNIEDHSTKVLQFIWWDCEIVYRMFKIWSHRREWHYSENLRKNAAARTRNNRNYVREKKTQFRPKSGLFQWDIERPVQAYCLFRHPAISRKQPICSEFMEIADFQLNYHSPLGGPETGVSPRRNPNRFRKKTRS